MAEVYELAMKIGVTGDALSSLQKISSQLSEIAGKAGIVNSKFNETLGTLGKIGLALTGAGVGILTGLDKIASVWDAILLKQKRAEAGGVSAAAAMKASAFALSVGERLRISGRELAEPMALFTQQYGEQIAERLLPAFAELKESLTNLGDPSDLMPWLRLLKTEGLKPEQIEERFRFLNRLVAAGQGTTAGQYITAYEASQGAFANMAAGARERLIPLMAGMPPGGRSNVGALLGREFEESLKGGKTQAALQALLPAGTDLRNLQNDWYKLSQKIAEGMFGPGGQFAGTPEDQRARVLNQVLRSQPGLAPGVANLLQRPILQGEYLQGAQSPFAMANIQGQTAEDINKITTITQAKRRAVAELDNLFAEMGKKGFTDEMLAVWKRVDDALEGLTAWVKQQDPETIKKIADGLIALSVALVAVGAALGAAVFLTAMGALVSPAGWLAALVAGLLALAAVDYGGIVEKLNSVEKAIQGWGQRMRDFFGGATPLAPGLVPMSYPGGGPGFGGGARLIQASFGGGGGGGFRTGGGFTMLGGSSSSFGGGGFAPLAAAAVSPRGDGSKTITAVTNLNISGRQLASAIEYYMIQALQSSGAAGAANGVGYPNGPDAQFSST